MHYLIVILEDNTDHQAEMQALLWPRWGISSTFMRPPRLCRLHLRRPHQHNGAECSISDLREEENAVRQHASN
jgi:hypothetical protein